jgi:hypothetical protein
MPGSQREPVAVTFAWVTQMDHRLQSEIRALFNASLELDDMIGFPGPLAADDDDYLAGLQFDVAAGRKQLLVGRAADGTFVAMALLTPSGMPNCRHLAEVSKCIIHPAWRGVGVLAAGLPELLTHCVTSGIEVLTLDVRKGTRAESLWQMLGFRVFGELPDYSRPNGRPEAGVYLWAPVHELIERQRAAAGARGAAAAHPVPVSSNALAGART